MENYKSKIVTAEAAVAAAVKDGDCKTDTRKRGRVVLQSCRIP